MTPMTVEQAQAVDAARARYNLAREAGATDDQAWHEAFDAATPLLRAVPAGMDAAVEAAIDAWLPMYESGRTRRESMTAALTAALPHLYESLRADAERWRIARRFQDLHDVRDWTGFRGQDDEAYLGKIDAPVDSYTALRAKGDG